MLPSLHANFSSSRPRCPARGQVPAPCHSLAHLISWGPIPPHRSAGLFFALLPRVVLRRPLIHLLNRSPRAHRFTPLTVAPRVKGGRCYFSLEGPWTLTGQRPFHRRPHARRQRERDLRRTRLHRDVMGALQAPQVGSRAAHCVRLGYYGLRTAVRCEAVLLSSGYSTGRCNLGQGQLSGNEQ